MGISFLHVLGAPKGPRSISREAWRMPPTFLRLLDNRVGTQEGPWGRAGMSRVHGLPVSSCLRKGWGGDILFLGLVFSSLSLPTRPSGRSRTVALNGGNSAPGTLSNIQGHFGLSHQGCY